MKINTLRTELDLFRRSTSASQTKQKARQERAIDLIDEVKDLKSRNLNRKVGIDFGETHLRNQKLIDAENLTINMGERCLIKDLTLLVRASSRVAFLGRNGCGKSTLIKTLIGDGHPYEGTIKRYDDLKVAYFEQKKDSLDPEQSVLKSICPDGDYVIFQGKPIYAKSYLSRFHFRGDQMDLKVKYLSGGEKSRILIARLMLQDCHLLILDEPTNDLDIETLDVLQECLESFSGAVILVSHNRFFMDQVCDEIFYFTEENGELIRFQGYFQWEEWNTQRLASSKKSQAVKEVIVEAKSEVPATAPIKKKGKLSYKEQTEFDQMEKTIADEELKLTEFQKEIALGSTAADYKKLNQLTDEISKQESKIKSLYQRWQDLESKMS
ncbi:MAG: ATP-binding cassette domain-containing protein [Pseudobdellovibrionaceae bacterium]